jgi:hypothetical protein
MCGVRAGIVSPRALGVPHRKQGVRGERGGGALENTGVLQRRCVLGDQALVDLRAVTAPLTRVSSSPRLTPLGRSIADARACRCWLRWCCSPVQGARLRPRRTGGRRTQREGRCSTGSTCSVTSASVSVSVSVSQKPQAILSQSRGPIMIIMSRGWYSKKVTFGGCTPSEVYVASMKPRQRSPVALPSSQRTWPS